jgi:hypothetical protein
MFARRLGWLLGDRFLMVEHTGRVSGERRPAEQGTRPADSRSRVLLSAEEPAAQVESCSDMRTRGGWRKAQMENCTVCHWTASR